MHVESGLLLLDGGFTPLGSMIPVIIQRDVLLYLPHREEESFIKCHVRSDDHPTRSREYNAILTTVHSHIHPSFGVVIQF